MRAGITGLYASGKGTVCSMFEELGAVVIDTDIIAREILEPGSECLNLVAEAFGTAFIQADGSLNRGEFAKFVFRDQERVKKLNSITHPEILKVTLKRSQGTGIFMINTPLLFESGFDRFMDKTITVTAGDEQILMRGKARDSLTETEIKDRLRHQIPLKEKIKLSDYVIDNSGSIDNTKRQVFELWNILKKGSRT